MCSFRIGFEGISKAYRRFYDGRTTPFTAPSAVVRLDVRLSAVRCAIAPANFTRVIQSGVNSRIGLDPTDVLFSPPDRSRLAAAPAQPSKSNESARVRSHGHSQGLRSARNAGRAPSLPGAGVTLRHCAPKDLVHTPDLQPRPQPAPLRVYRASPICSLLPGYERSNVNPPQD